MINDYVYEALSFRSSPLYSDVKDAAMDLTVTSLEVFLSFHLPPNNLFFSGKPGSSEHNAVSARRRFQGTGWICGRLTDWMKLEVDRSEQWIR